VSRKGYLVEIVHAGPAEMPVGHLKTRRLDNMGRHVKARAQAQNRAGVLGDVGLEKRNLHSVIALSVKVLSAKALGSS
jgi:hypothetical protein